MRTFLKMLAISACLALGLCGCQDSASPNSSGKTVVAPQAASSTTPAVKTATRPEKALTTGAVVASVTSAAVCTPTFVTKAAKVPTARAVQVFAKYGIAWADHASYQLDHLVPVSLGGSNVQANLWPQSHATSARKDRLENRLHNLVCSHKLALASAQRIIRGDWVAAYTKYGGSTRLTYPASVKQTTIRATVTPSPVATTEPPAAPTTTAPRVVHVTTAPTVDNHGGATAQCNDGTLSFSAHRSGTCSHHGGVAIWF